ncbi:hypothetical protein [Mycolicibacterium baixiangningiae]|uniref:hypothetical protein n=1 Tax=Mycolicibacterium baixiangningiae TaxID=2761578 RepID=UPI0018D0174A|nr:hypothetical protein [Mycolicibacterium baixiangningiae]
MPPEWTVPACDATLGWETPCQDGAFGTCPIQLINGAAELENPVCKGNWRAVSGLDGPIRSDDINQVVQRRAALVADIYTSESGKTPTVSLSAPRQRTVAGAPAVQIVATVSGVEADECNSPSALHSIVATTVPNRDGAVVFVVALDQGYPGAPDPALLHQLIDSLQRN